MVHVATIGVVLEYDSHFVRASRVSYKCTLVQSAYLVLASMLTITP